RPRGNPEQSPSPSPSPSPSHAAPNKKPGARPGFSCSASAKTPEDLIVLVLLPGGRQRLDAGRQCALVARGLVAVNDVLVHQRIHQRLGFLEGGHRVGLVTGGEGIVDLAQGRA